MFGACSKSEDHNENFISREYGCNEMMLKEFNMAPYIGQNDACITLSLYKLKGTDYYVYDCCLCDIIWYNPIDCKKVSYILVDGKYSEVRSKYFFSEAKKIGIVGVKD
jgi:hypothetical protein